MSGQATVAIGSKQWTVEVAVTPTELTTGLSNRASISANTGMFFDLGGENKSIDINMSEMMFPLDIVFVSEAKEVVGVASNVQPGSPLYFRNTDLPGARYFIEVNADEAEGIEVGDSVTIEGYTATAQWDVSSIMNLTVLIMVVISMGKMTFNVLKPKHHSIHGLEKTELVRQYGSWAVGRAEAMCPEDDVACVGQEAERLYTSSRMRRMTK